MTPWLGFMLTTLGLSALALAMDRHHQQLWQRAPSALIQWSCRAIGITLLTGVLLVSVRSSGWVTGLVEWTGLLTAAATCVVLALTYRSKLHSAK